MEGVYRLDWTPPPLKVSKESAARTVVQRPHRDLILLKTFQRWFDGKLPSDFGLPVARVWQDDRPPLEGLLIRATSWNPPEGCRRIISEDSYAFVRSQEVANDSTEMKKGDTDKAWTRSIEDVEAPTIVVSSTTESCHVHALIA